MDFEYKDIICVEDNTENEISLPLVKEEPLLIMIQGKPYLTVMRTPGEEKALIIGLCLTEGIIDKLEEVTSIGFCNEDNINIGTINLVKSKFLSIQSIFEEKRYTSNTSCGICGKQMISELLKTTNPIRSKITINVNEVIKKLNSINNFQILKHKTKAAHCSVIYDANFNFLSSAEDVGRHNTLDKAIGLLLIKGNLKKAKIITISSRISYEIVQKAAMAKIPILSGISRPTSLAVSMAKKLNITLATLSPNDGLMIYSNKHRFFTSKKK